MHTHISAIAIGSAFVGILLMGTLWRLIAGHFVISDNATLTNIGKVMAFQY